MEYVYSKVKPELITHIMFAEEDFGEARDNIIPSDEFLQCSALYLNEWETFRPHKHIIREQINSEYIAQEAWVIIKGAVESRLYDIDDSLIGNRFLYPGDVIITLYGGHNYVALQDNTLVYEFKTGPYLGQKLDKEFINV